MAIERTFSISKPDSGAQNVSGHIDDGNVSKAMSELGEFASDVKVLGSYPVALL